MCQNLEENRQLQRAAKVYVSLGTQISLSSRRGGMQDWATLLALTPVLLPPLRCHSRCSMWHYITEASYLGSTKRVTVAPDTPENWSTLYQVWHNSGPPLNVWFLL